MPSRFWAASTSGLMPMFQQKAGGISVPALAPSAFWDISDASTLFQTGTRASPGTPATADGDPVGLVLDKSGADIDLAQATATNRPTLRVSGALRWLEFDGVDNYLATAAYTDPGLNWNSVHAFRTISIVGGNQVHSHSNGNVTLYRAAGGFTMFSNPTDGPAISVAVGTDAVVTEHWLNPGPCKLAKDKDAYVNSPSISQNFNGHTGIGGTVLGGGFTNTRWYGGAFKRNPIFTDAEITTLRDYFAGLQGRVI